MTTLLCTRDDPWGFASASTDGHWAALFVGGDGDSPTTSRAASPPPSLNPTRHDPPPQTAGQGATTTYDAWRRTQYTGSIKRMSTEALQAIDLAEADANLARAQTLARQASDARNTIRTATQRQLTPGGRVMSELLEQDRSWSAIVGKYSGAAEPTFDTWKSVAAATGRSSRDMVTLTRASKVLGPLGVVLGAGVAAYEVSRVPDAEKPRVAARETGGVLGGAAGGTLGMIGGTMLLGALVSNPVGWMIIGAGLLGGAVLGYVGSEGGRLAGGAVYDAAGR